MPTDSDAVIDTTVARHADRLKTLARQLHANPELGMVEHQAVAWQAELLGQLGFRVTVPFGGLDTAYLAVRGEGAPVVCFLAEYDALPGIGHGCGHNLIAPAAIAAGAGLADALQSAGLPGTVQVMGTPGEEGKGGKVLLAKTGAFDAVDLALMAHPRDRATSDRGRLAIMRYDVTFHGQSAHAAVYPELGRNALDGVMLLYAGINAWRQHLPEPCRVHGIVTDGGEAPNVVPDRAGARFYLRAPDEATLAAMAERFARIAEGAALMTATRAELATGGDLPYAAGRVSAVLNEAYLAVADALAMAPQRTGKPGRGSSDFGDVSLRVPGAHYYFGIVPPPASEEPNARGEHGSDSGDAKGRGMHRPAPLPSHSPQFAQAAGTDYALDNMLLAARALARVGARFVTDATFREQVREEWRADRA